MKTEKWMKTAIEVVGFPFTLTNMYFNRKRKVNEIGQRLKIRNKLIHTVVSGERNAKYTVILDAGLSCCCLDWHYIQPQVSKFARVLSFDRAGYGWSSCETKIMRLDLLVRAIIRISVNLCFSNTDEESIETHSD